MKRTLSLILSLMMLISIVGCNKTNPNGTENNNDNKEQTINLNDTYRFYYDYYNGGHLMKLNVKTGSKTTVCSDPVCDHGFECPFSDISLTPVVVGDNVFFCRNATEKKGLEPLKFENSIVSYSFTTGEVKRAYELPISFGEQPITGLMIVIGEHIYFYVKESFTEEEMLLGDFKYTLYRVPLSGGKREKMCTMDHFAYRYVDKYIVYEDPEHIDILLAFDTETKTMREFIKHPEARNIEQLDLRLGEKRLFVLIGSDVSQIYEYDIESGEYELFYEYDRFNCVQIINDEIYFVHEGKICKVNSETMEPEIIFEDPQGEILDFLVHGDSYISYSLKSNIYDPIALNLSDLK